MTSDPSGNSGTPPSWSPEPPPQPKQSQRAGIFAILVLLGVAIAIGGGLYVFRDRLSGSASELAVGECIDNPVGTLEIKDVQHQPCSEPHDGEVFAVVRHTAAPGAAYPDEAEFDDMAGDECLPLLQSYTGMDLVGFVTAGVDFAYLYPTEESWNNGDRTVTCYILKADRSKLTRSLRDAGSSPSPS